MADVGIYTVLLRQPRKRAVDALNCSECHISMTTLDYIWPTRLAAALQAHDMQVSDHVKHRVAFFLKPHIFINRRSLQHTDRLLRAVPVSSVIFDRVPSSQVAAFSAEDGSWFAGLEPAVIKMVLTKVRQRQTRHRVTAFCQQVKAALVLLSADLCRS